MISIYKQSFLERKAQKMENFPPIKRSRKFFWKILKLKECGIVLIFSLCIFAATVHAGKIKVTPIVDFEGIDVKFPVLKAVKVDAGIDKAGKGIQARYAGEPANGTIKPDGTVTLNFPELTLISAKEQISVQIGQEFWKNISPMTVGATEYTSEQQKQAEKRVDAEGKIDPPLAPPPPSLEFSKDSLESLATAPISFTSELEFIDGTIIPLDLIEFQFGINFFPTENPNIFLTQFVEYEFEYTPFSISDTFFDTTFEVSQEVLDTSQIFTGIGDFAIGELGLPVQTKWLTTDGIKVATTYQVFNVDLTPISENVVAFSAVGSGNFVAVPEPSTMLLLGSGLLGLAAVGRRNRVK